MKPLKRIFAVSIFQTVFVFMACAPAVQEIGRESESNSIVSGDGDYFQAIVPLFRNRSGGSDTTISYQSLKHGTQDWVCFYALSWRSNRGNVNVIYSELLGSTMFGTLDELIRRSESEEVVKILWGNADRGPVALVDQGALARRNAGRPEGAVMSSDDKAAAAAADDQTAFRVDERSLRSVKDFITSNRVFSYPAQRDACPAASSRYFSPKNNDGKSLFARLAKAKNL